MKLVDAPPEVRASLNVVRWLPRGARQPANGELWFTDACAVCGTTTTPRYQDHCHITGLYRGQLCPSCNTAEGINRGDHWPFWRLHAPGLAHREIVQGERSTYLTIREVMTLPLVELFALNAARADAEDLAWIVADLYPEVAS